jgi:putative mRNA 3-end processing factor
MHIDNILRWEKEGLYCIPGDFYIDSWGPVKLNLISHAHSDHARRGAIAHLCTESSLPFILHRLGSDINIEGLPFGEKRKIDQTWVSFHSAGHILGSESKPDRM